MLVKCVRFNRNKTSPNCTLATLDGDPWMTSHNYRTSNVSQPKAKTVWIHCICITLNLKVDLDIWDENVFSFKHKITLRLWCWIMYCHKFLHRQLVKALPRLGQHCEITKAHCTFYSISEVVSIGFWPHCVSLLLLKIIDRFFRDCWQKSTEHRFCFNSDKLCLLYGGSFAFLLILCYRSRNTCIIQF